MPLQIDPSRCPLVIAGAWNQAIFAPEFVQQNIIRAELAPTAEVALANGIWIPTYTGPLYTLTVRPDRLVFRPLNAADENLDSIEQAAHRLLGLLKVTPIHAVGVNAGYFAPPDSKKLIEIFDLPDCGSFREKSITVKSTTVRHRLLVEGKTLNLAIVREDDAFKIDINFHIDVADAPAAAARLAEQPIRSYREYATRLLFEVYELKPPQ